MVRERLNAIDVAAVVGNLQKEILHYNLVNIYDVTSRVYVLKFSKNEDKKFVLFEIGHRIHTTQFLRNTDHLPSNFNVKLRKHLRTRKLRGIEQIAQDRVVDFTFSSDEYAYHLIVQFFLPGNVYLTDYAYKVLAVLRPQNAGEAFFKVGQTYEIPEASVPWGVPVSRDVVNEALRMLTTAANNVAAGSGGPDSLDSRNVDTGNHGASKGAKGNPKGKSQTGSKESKAEPEEIANEVKDQDSLHALLKAIFPSVHVSLMDHVLKTTTGDARVGSRNVTEIDPEKLHECVEAIRQAVLSVAQASTVVPGYLYKGGQEYHDFSPFDFGNASDRFDDFNHALDAYFTNFEVKKIEKEAQPKKPIKLKKIKDDQDRRELKRQKGIEKLTSDIELVESNRVVFDQVLSLIRSLVASGASWREIVDQLSLQRERGHMLARHIRSVNIPERRVDVCLPSDDPNFYGSGPSQHGKLGKKSVKSTLETTDLDDRSSATLDYGLTCFQNLETLYANKKQLTEKLERTRIGREFALKRVDDQKEKEKQKKSGKSVSLVKVRKRMWFEKFHWFVTSDGFLVLGGRDSTQNELLVKRYLTKGDMYFHADVHGGSSCILKNPNGTAEAFPNSIEEAACFAICLSSAWTQKMVVPAWWVHHHQVSRSAPTGEYLPHGSFMIRGKKNYVQPQRLEMAIGVMFHIDAPQLQGLDIEQQSDSEGEEDDVSDDFGTADTPVPNDGVRRVKRQGTSGLPLYGNRGEAGDSVTSMEDGDSVTASADPNGDAVSSDHAHSSEKDLGDSDDGAESVDSGESENSDVTDDIQESDDSDSSSDFTDESDLEDDSDLSPEKSMENDYTTNHETKVDGSVSGSTEALTNEKPLDVTYGTEVGQAEPLNKSVCFSVDEAAPSKPKRSVRFDLSNIISPASDVRDVPPAQRLLRKGTGYPCQGFNPDELVDKLSQLGLVDSDQSYELPSSVRFAEPEKVEHTPEALQYLRQRMPTGIVGKSKKQGGPSKLAGIKAARARKKYGEDDEETQELRRKLTGSKMLKHVEQQAAAMASNDRSDENKNRTVYQRREIKPLDKKELSSHMDQLRMLSKEPSPSDVIVSAVPMCAPYNALKTHPYHLKLVPGNIKKGAIASQALQHFLKVDDTKAPYVKLITTDQFALTLIENCKIPGNAAGPKRPSTAAK
ncbi:MJ1625 yease Yp1009cp-like domain-containing protein, putative [Babesia ovata]|uniref:Ribosome quality control complex subunit 2 n=1 Tax=Babesia ovata TaxID=189622 RepID=A0A2H6KHN3_9APIC|nr:MJ1625 yease Yp1009cp-like domain-containing protein, putative [Babesia ovata]GBE62502.1 MJ1625 yease Yp1009cp-like domain-containing protein, putative [Babesia ovata]